MKQISEKKGLSLALSKRELLNRIENAREREDDLQAMRLCQRYVRRFGRDEDVVFTIAELYEDCKMYPQAINEWYRFWDLDAENMEDAIDGLSACYCACGDASTVAKLVKNFLEFDLDEFGFNATPALPDLRLVYPPALADYTDEIFAAAADLRSERVAESRKRLIKIPPESKRFYSQAQNLLAAGYLIEGKVERALQLCEDVLKTDELNVFALANICTAYMRTGDYEKGLKYVNPLLKSTASTPDEIYRKALALGEYGYDDEAFALFSRLIDDVGAIDKQLEYYRIVAAFNSGKVDYAQKLAVHMANYYIESIVIRYLSQFIIEHSRFFKDKADSSRLPYDFKLPASLELEYRKKLYGLSYISKKIIRETFDMQQVDQMLNWAFETGDSVNIMLAIDAAVQCDRAEFLKQILIDAYTSAEIKQNALRALALSNKDMRCGFVHNGLYKKIIFKKVPFGRQRHKAFVKAYAQCVSTMYIQDEQGLSKLCDGALEAYRKIMGGNANLVKDGYALACAIYVYSGIRFSPHKSIYEHFYTSEAHVTPIVQYLVSTPSSNTDKLTDF